MRLLAVRSRATAIGRNISLSRVFLSENSHIVPHESSAQIVFIWAGGDDDDDDDGVCVCVRARARVAPPHGSPLK